MNTFARLRGLAAATTILTVAGAGALAPPALAAAPSITIVRPGDDQKLPSESFAVEALASMGDGVLVGKIKVSVVPLDANSEQAPLNGEFAANERAEQRVTFPVTVDYNGHYRALVTATGRDNRPPLLEDRDLENRTATRDFFVVAPPAPPTNVRPVIDKESRAVTLSWNANTEKDMLFYVVQRAKGDGPFSPLGKTDGPSDTSIIDPSTAEAAGEYRYQVVAVRKGATSGEGVNSDPSPVASASVPGPPAPATTVPGGTTGGTTPGGGTNAGSTPSNTTGTTLSPSSPGALKASGTLDLSGFSSMKNQARRSAPRSEAPDTGFTEALPFGTTDTTRLVDENEQAAAPEDDPEVRELGAEDASNDRQRSAAFLAAGLLATVLLMHLLWIKGEVQREPLEAVPPELAPE